MEKRKKIVKFLVAILLGILWCIVGSIFHTLFWMAAEYPYIFPYETLIVEGYFMTMVIYYFHEITNGTWKNYLELGFLLVFCILEGWFLHMDRQGFSNIADFGYKFMPICLVAMLVSFFLYKCKQKKKQQCKLTKINKSAFTILTGFWSYLGITLIGDNAFISFLMLIISPIFIVSYIVIAQKILKREYRWKLFCAYIFVFFILFLKVCIMSMLEIDIYGYRRLEEFFMLAIPFGIAVAIGEQIVCVSDKRNDSKSAKPAEENVEPNKGWQVNRMEKKSKLLPILISIPISILGYLIYYIVCKTAVPAFVVLTLLNEKGDFLYIYMDVYGMIFVWLVLIAESYCMIMILIRFHKATNGMAVGYPEGCLLLWICGILGQTFMSGQQLKLSTVLLLESDISILKDIRMMLLCLIVFGVSSLFYKIGQKKKVKGFKWKINKRILIFLLICLSCIVLIGVAFYIWIALTWQPING